MKDRGVAASLLLAAGLGAACSHRAAAPQATPASVMRATPRWQAQRLRSAVPPVVAVTARAEIRRAPPSSAPAVTPAPAIFAVWVRPLVVHAGDHVTWTVKTTTDVTTVEAKAAGFIIPLQRDAPGSFSTTFQIPPETPGLLHGSYRVDVEAGNDAGAKATSSLTMKLE